ncbi:MAG TPA: TIGR03862 family flavoprotein [Hyphomonadaceae bacterium]|nr:TIGR03862 family flavoprotein [Hyphomonadaceae bacterium]
MSGQQKQAIVVGAGPAGLAAAEVLAGGGVAVTIHERMPNPARKFLLAGRGGLNLTHSEPLERFLDRYGLARSRLEPAIRAFSPSDLRAWCEGLGVETFVGSSGRVFPKAMKASPLLRAWLARLDGLGVKLRARSRWTGWDGEALTFETPDGPTQERADVAVFALGGGSWPRLGSDGSWQEAFASHGAQIEPLRPSNSGFLVNWSDVFKAKFAGQPLKRVKLSYNGDETRGEAMVTRYGIEGGAVYALSPALRDGLVEKAVAQLEIDLMPDVDLESLIDRLTLSGAGKASLANRLRKAGLSPIAASLLREDAFGTNLPSNPVQLAQRIKGVNIPLAGVAPIERAISTAGGVSWDSIAKDYSLTSDRRTFVCGEMLDWEAPTGGYLLQACISTGRAAGQGALSRLMAA